jgi:CTP synthase
MSVKYIFVTGGVVSSIGKGIAAASLGRLLRSRGLGVAPMKLDPYINVDAGTMNPYQHGEVFVTDDGTETDLDLGHYERFIDATCSAGSSITTGKVYRRVIDAERRGEYLGATVQVIPHVTNEIKNSIIDYGKQQEADVVLAEIGGTVGDIESLPFLEAIRQMRKELGRENTLFIHVTFVPQVGPWGEIKTKPTQHSVINLREIGIAPDVLVCRSEAPLGDEVKEKLSLFCDVPAEAIIESRTAETIYEVPLMYEALGLGDLVVQRLNLPKKEPRLAEWEALVERIKRPSSECSIAVIGKYTSNGDAYKSIAEALVHAGIANDAKVHVKWIESDTMEQGNIPESVLDDVQAVIVAPGFGGRGIEGKIAALRYVREQKIPFLGICLGMQMAVIEYARNVCGLNEANSEEFGNSPYPVIHFIPDQIHVTEKGATMRLGSYPCNIAPGTLAHLLYGDNRVSERHRHRYEVNNDFRETLISHGLVVSGVSPDYRLVEMIELPQETHPFFVGVQSHPEFKSRPNRPHPLFKGLVKAALHRASQVGVE